MTWEHVISLWVGRTLLSLVGLAVVYVLTTSVCDRLLPDNGHIYRFWKVGLHCASHYEYTSSIRETHHDGTVVNWSPLFWRFMWRTEG
jgi:hypothetical protein